MDGMTRQLGERLRDGGPAQACGPPEIGPILMQHTTSRHTAGRACGAPSSGVVRGSSVQFHSHRKTSRTTAADACPSAARLWERMCIGFVTAVIYLCHMRARASTAAQSCNHNHRLGQATQCAAGLSIPAPQPGGTARDLDTQRPEHGNHEDEGGAARCVLCLGSDKPETYKLIL